MIKQETFDCIKTLLADKLEPKTELLLLIETAIRGVENLTLHKPEPVGADLARDLISLEDVKELRQRFYCMDTHYERGAGTISTLIVDIETGVEYRLQIEAV